MKKKNYQLIHTENNSFASILKKHLSFLKRLNQNLCLKMQKKNIRKKLVENY